MERVRPWCGQPSDRGRLKEQNRTGEVPVAFSVLTLLVGQQEVPLACKN